jgi:hypothetical protein
VNKHNEDFVVAGEEEEAADAAEAEAEGAGGQEGGGGQEGEAGGGSKRTVTEVLRALALAGHDADRIWREVRLVTAATVAALAPALSMQMGPWQGACARHEADEAGRKQARARAKGAAKGKGGGFGCGGFGCGGFGCGGGGCGSADAADASGAGAAAASATATATSSSSSSSSSSSGGGGGGGSSSCPPGQQCFQLLGIDILLAYQGAPLQVQVEVQHQCRSYYSITSAVVSNVWSAVGLTPRRCGLSDRCRLRRR